MDNEKIIYRELPINFVPCIGDCTGITFAQDCSKFNYLSNDIAKKLQGMGDIKQKPDIDNEKNIYQELPTNFVPCSGDCTGISFGQDCSKFNYLSNDIAQKFHTGLGVGEIERKPVMDSEKIIYRELPINVVPCSGDCTGNTFAQDCSTFNYLSNNIAQKLHTGLGMQDIIVHFTSAGGKTKGP